MSVSGQEPASPVTLRRTLGLPGATMLGLGSIVGTGVFVSLVFAVNLAGEWAALAVLPAALLALCNGLSSAQLAAANPVSGGAYEYGYRYLNAPLGFTAGWMFLVAKGASAATAALGFSFYLTKLVPGLNALDVRIPAVTALVALTLLVSSGLKRSVRANAVLVGISLTALLAFVFCGQSLDRPQAVADPSFEAPAFLHATALLFVAFTGYGRVATMGEEIQNPTRNIPIAVATTVGTSAGLYLAVTLTLLRLSAGRTISPAAPLIDAGSGAFPAWLQTLVVGGAVAAMLGVLMNLLLGLSRVVLAMARRHDLPAWLGALSRDGESPDRAVLLVAAGIGGLILIGNLQMTWSLSALTVLVYYATANLCALRQPIRERRVPRIVSAAGLGGCLFLAVWIPPSFWIIGAVLFVVGLGWHVLATRLFSGDCSP